jgi:hypothetical protein
MAKSTRLWFSQEHTSKSNPSRHVDSYRKQSDSSRTQKTGHSTINPGYGSAPKSVNTRRGK